MTRQNLHVTNSAGVQPPPICVTYGQLRPGNDTIVKKEPNTNKKERERETITERKRYRQRKNKINKEKGEKEK